MVLVTKYEALACNAEKIGIDVIEVDLEGKSGYILNNTIFINQNMNDISKRCVLAEELGHYFKNYGDITNQEDIKNKKQEIIARRWSYEHLVGVVDLINAHKKGCYTKYDIAEYLNITEDILENALKYYQCKYDNGCKIDNYWINFNNGLEILEMF